MMLRKPRDGDPGVVISTSHGTEAMQVMQQRLYRDSPFLELPEGQVCTLGATISDAELRRQYPVFHAYLQQYSPTSDLIGVDLSEPLTGMTFRLRGARLVGEPAFGEHERQLLAWLLPRLRIAIALYARIALQQLQLSVLDQTAGQLAIGSMLLDDAARVLLKNVVSDRILQQRDGLYLRNGVLHCHDAADDRALRALIQRMTRPAAGPEAATPPQQLMQVRRAGGERGWSLLLRSSRAQPGLEESASATVTLLLRDASRTPEVSDASLIELLGLTRAEAALAVCLVRGQSINEAAVSLGISRNTARTQLASIFARTGTNRQPQLVSHILGTLGSTWG
jgi:DNA-binding CsgD family transcriptional regulator